MHALTRQLVSAVAALVAVLAVWQTLVLVVSPPPYLLPAPARVAEALWDDRALIAEHFAATGGIAVAGLALGIAVGVLAAVVMTLAEPLRRLAEPILVASQAIPPVIFTPLLIVLLGLGPFPKILVVALGAFFPVAIGTAAAMRNADAYLVDLLASMGASRGLILRRVRLPSSVPNLVASAKVSASYAVFSAIVAEWMGSSAGLGVYLQRSQASYQTEQIYAAVVVIAAFGILLFWVASGLGSLVLARRTHLSNTPRTSRRRTP
ncbi:MAG: ABC transporter permease [Leucobacter sp.]